MGLRLEAATTELSELRALCAQSQLEFSALYDDRLAEYRAIVAQSVASFLDEFRQNLKLTSGENPFCIEFAEQITDYLDWLQWTFWDFPYFALALNAPADRLDRAVRTCGMAYLSARIMDDVIDRHFSYKGNHGTLLETFEKGRLSHQRAEGLTILAGLLVCFSGLSQLAEGDREGSTILCQVIHSLRQTIIGATMEMSPREQWSQPFYDRMIQLKNVDFWRALYVGIDPHRESPLYPFLNDYYALVQKLNDVQDLPEDERRGQPNLVSLSFPREHPVLREPPDGTVNAVPAAVEASLAKDFLQLGGQANSLPQLERLIARVKLHERLIEAERLGLFVSDAALPAREDSAPDPPLKLDWYSTLEDTLRRLGADALVDVSCAVCGSAERKRLFEKQGFTFHRCLECSHVYVSPRITGTTAWRISMEVDERDHESSLMIAQKFYASAICKLLRLRAPGPRLLDIGFGQGWVLQLASSFGFEAYGTESSLASVNERRPEFGDRLHLATAADNSLPWQGFDAVVISHVLEHMEDPGAFLNQIYHCMNPDGVLYAAVPDIESLQFQLFGKRWEVISPLAHFQYFSQATLSRLLRQNLFTDLERIDHGHIMGDFVPRSIRLMRKLGGTHAGELAILCRRPNL